jgi:alkylhydroperoxidase family enzyme
MARLAYFDLDAADTQLRELAGRIATDRGGRLINQYRMLLHSPPLAAAWLEFASAVRFQTTLDGASIELAICYVSQLAGAEYPFRAHSRLALRSGLTQQQLHALSAWRGSNLFSDQERAILAYVEGVTRDGCVDTNTFAHLRRWFDDRGLVELTVVIGFYLMVARLLTALEIEPEAEP